MAEYERRKSGDNESKSLTLRAFSDGLPTAGDLRNFLTTKRSPPKQKQRGVEEHVVRDYRYPQTMHEITWQENILQYFSLPKERYRGWN